ncbi:alpha/beta hydrolase-fold protein [Alkalihalobacillus sp. CinArs1]|uniref:alpha/beta hydrolase-fold protein n=1 Tax=Alkalihalobacillus sp. CinArs1 TaxID=2995314 RepID=UPI0022DD16C5|nr:alpha/beta hydrolase-fold protein [Alkalihalobacillus sp. CinArs1]
MNIQEIRSPFSYNEISSMKQLETPIVKHVDDGIEIHFIYFGNEDTSSVHVLGSFPGWELQGGEMTRLEESDIWVKSFLADSAFASTYYFSINDDYGDDWGERFKHMILDPLNPNTMVFSEVPGDPHTAISYVEGDEKLATMNLRKKGNVYKEMFNSSVLHNERNLWIYDPIEVDTPKNVLILFDGFQYTDAIPAPAMIDHLYDEGKIPATVIIGVDSPDRFTEFVGNDVFTQFLTDELLPWIRDTFRVNRDKIVLGGASLGGLAAFYSAISRPDLFGGVLSQSGSFNHKKWVDWPVHHMKNESKQHPVRIYMNAGKLEVPALQEANNQTYSALKRNGYDVTYDVFNGGHDVLWWRETFPRGLEYVFK